MNLNHSLRQVEPSRDHLRHDRSPLWILADPPWHSDAVGGRSHHQSRVEAQMRRLKSFGERIASRDPDRQAAEIHTRIALMNRFSALGTAEIVRVA